MPEFQRGNSTAFLNPAPPLDEKASSHYAISPPPRDWDARRVNSYLREYNRHMLQSAHDPRGLPGPLRPARILQSPSVADPHGCCLRRVRRRVGGLHRADDARPGLRRRRPRPAAAPAQVVSPLGDQRHPRQQDALRRDDRRGGARVPDPAGVSVGRRSTRQDDAGETKLLPAIDLFRRPNGVLPTAATGCSASRASSSTWAATTRRYWITAHCR